MLHDYLRFATQIDKLPPSCPLAVLALGRRLLRPWHTTQHFCQPALCALSQLIEIDRKIGVACCSVQGCSNTDSDGGYAERGADGIADRHWAVYDCKRHQGRSTQETSGQEAGALVETRRIHELKWRIANVGVEVCVACHEPDRIFADKPLQAGVVVSRPIVVQPRAVILPARVLSGIGRSTTRHTRAAERLVAVRGSDRPAGIGEAHH